MTNLIHFFDCLVLTLQVFGKIIVNFSPAIVMIVVCIRDRDGFKTYAKTAAFGNREKKVVHKNHKAYKRNAKHRENLLAYA